MVEPPKSESRAAQIVILLFAGVALSIGSCAGFLTLKSGSSPVGILLAMGFFAGLIVMIGAFIWAIIRLARRA